MSKKIRNQIRSLIAGIFAIALAFSFNMAPAIAAESVEVNETEIVPAALVTVPCNWGGIRSQTGKNLGTVHLEDGVTYELVVNFKGINGTTGSANLHIYGAFGFKVPFDKDIPVDGVGRIYTFTPGVTYDYVVDLGTCSGGDFAYSISIYKH